jgi:hypothetical protein
MGRKPHVSKNIADKAEVSVRDINDAHELRKARVILLSARFSFDFNANKGGRHECKGFAKDL